MVVAKMGREGGMEKGGEVCMKEKEGRRKSARRKKLGEDIVRKRRESGREGRREGGREGEGSVKRLRKMSGKKDRREET